MTTKRKRTARRVVVTVELETPLTLADLRKGLRLGCGPWKLTPLQVQANAIRGRRRRARA